MASAEQFSIVPTHRTEEQLLWLGGCGREPARGSKYFYDARLRNDPPHVALQLTLGGRGFYQRNGESRVELPVGWAFLDQIPGNFSYGWVEGTYDLVFVSFTGLAATRWMEHIHGQYGPVLDLGADQSVQQTMLSLVDAYAAGRLADRYLLSGQLYGLLMQLLSVLARRRIATTPLVAECLSVIAAEADRANLNVNALARRMKRSREHLAREFRRATGMSLLTYLTQSRVRLAAAELRAGEAKLELVARRSGFRSAAYLCRVFKETVGVTPVQFRDRPWLVAP